MISSIGSRRCGTARRIVSATAVGFNQSQRITSLALWVSCSGSLTARHSSTLAISTFEAPYLAEKLGASKGRSVQFNAGPTQVDIGIIEAAFVGRDIGRTDDTADSIVDRVRQSVEAGRHVFLLTPPGDYGLYLFLHLYDQVIAKATRAFEARLFLDSLILDQISLIEWRMKRKQVGSLDGACRVWLDKRATLGESVRVFDFVVDPSGNVDELVRRRIRGLFILNDKLVANPEYCPQGVRQQLEADGLDVLLVGKAATMAADDDSRKARHVFGAGPWLLHSSEGELANYLLTGPQQYDDVYLFHNFPRRLDKFAKSLRERGFSGGVRAL